MKFDHYYRTKTIHFIRRDYNHKTDEVVICDTRKFTIKEKSNILNELILFPLGLKKRKGNEVTWEYEDEEVKKYWENANVIK